LGAGKAHLPGPHWGNAKGLLQKRVTAGRVLNHFNVVWRGFIVHALTGQARRVSQSAGQTAAAVGWCSSRRDSPNLHGSTSTSRWSTEGGSVEAQPARLTAVDKLKLPRHDKFAHSLLRGRVLLHPPGSRRRREACAAGQHHRPAAAPRRLTSAQRTRPPHLNTSTRASCQPSEAEVGRGASSVSYT
jgi:hypothetical protein